jgi:hypothetical protein
MVNEPYLIFGTNRGHLNSSTFSKYTNEGDEIKGLGITKIKPICNGAS